MAVPTPEAAAQEARRRAWIEEQEKNSKRLEWEALQELRKSRRQKNLAICVGSGVTLFSTMVKGKGVQDRLTWKGFIRNGFDYLQTKKPNYYEDNRKRLEKAVEDLYDNDSNVEDVLHVANTLTQSMDKCGCFSDWLSSQFNKLHRHVKDNAILESLRKLHEADVTLMTTNYDGLIENYCRLQPLDGSQPQQLVQFIRRNLPNVVFHPHGYWENPNHIVLDSRQYYEVGREDNGVRETLKDVLKARTVVFVGCGAGLGDPNFGQLLQWLGKQQKDVNYGHYILLKKGDDYRELDSLPLNKVHVVTFEDIAPWLEGLLLDPDWSSDPTLE
ncbi:hypothetical protein AnigIFM56816_007211 [Aspergillus niger]|nr:hypothetical protein AnigIFM56816_007211 [Aspergillus niger]